MLCEDIDSGDEQEIENNSCASTIDVEEDIDEANLQNDNYEARMKIRP